MYRYLSKNEIEKYPPYSLCLLDRIGSWEERFWGGEGSNYASAVSDSGKRAISMLLFKEYFYILNNTFTSMIARILGSRNPMYLQQPLLASRELIADAVSTLTGQLDSSPEDLTEDRPMLEKYLQTAEKQTSTYFLEILSHTEQNRAEIEKVFFNSSPLGMLEDISADSADRHHSGRFVCILTFEHGKVVYKPRNLSLDLRVKEFAETFLPDTVIIPDIISFATYAFESYIRTYPAQGEDEAEKYYYNLGGTCALLHILGATDFHKENIAASGVHPVLFDLETIIGPVPKSSDILTGFKDGRWENDNIYKDFSYSIAQTMLLPLLINNQQYSVLLSKNEPCSSGPLVNGVQQDVRPFFCSFEKGFSDTYDSISGRKEEAISFLDSFGTCSVRLILRASNAYAKILSNTYLPEHLTSEERAEEAYCQLMGPGCNPDIAGAEIRSLRVGDIPYFNTFGSSVNLYSEGHLVSENFYCESSVENAKRRIERMSDREREFELEVIRKSIENALEPSREKPETAPLGETIGDDRIADEVREIFDLILLRRISGLSGRSGWLKIGKDRTYSEIAPPGILGGSTGISVFAANYWNVFKDPRAKELAQGSMLDVLDIRDRLKKENSPSDAGAIIGFDGIAGLIRSLLLVSRQLGDDEYEKAALDMVDSLNRVNLRQNSVNDFNLGIAGLLYVISTEPVLAQYPKRTELVKKLADILLENRKLIFKNHNIWETSNKKHPVSGLAHGCAGIGLSLLCADQLIHDGDVCDAGMEALRAEHELYSEKLKTWPDYRNTSVASQYVHGICSGAPGMGMVYLELYRMGIHDFDDDLERAIAKVLSEEALYRDHYCCGNSGVISFLQQAGIILERNDLINEAELRAAQMIQRKVLNGSYIYISEQYSNSFIPGFSHGISGVGNTLLKLIFPGIPSIHFE